MIGYEYHIRGSEEDERELYYFRKPLPCLIACYDGSMLNTARIE